MTAATLWVGTLLFLVSTTFDIKHHRVPNTLTASLYTIATIHLLNKAYSIQTLIFFTIALLLGYLVQAKGQWAAADKHYLALPLIFLPYHHMLPYILIYAAYDIAWNWIHEKKDNQHAPYLPVPTAAYLTVLLIQLI